LKCPAGSSRNLAPIEEKKYIIKHTPISRKLKTKGLKDGSKALLTKINKFLIIN
jgi:hypothetical protein